jgi:hypothetical protein
LAVLACSVAATKTSSEEVPADRPVIQIPSNLQIVGHIAGGRIPTGVPVLVRVAADDSIIGQGSVIDEKGTFFIEISQDSSFNGTELYLAVVTAGKVLSLQENGHEATFLFVGGFPFPTRLVREFTLNNNLNGDHPLSRQISMPVKATCPPELRNCDVNGDGRFDSDDAKEIQERLLSDPGDPAADLNHDGMVNTRDLVLLTHFLNLKY